jgi:hypothetical protein
MGFGTKREPPHAGRSLPLISVLAGLARSSHWIVVFAMARCTGRGIGMRSSRPIGLRDCVRG